MITDKSPNMSIDEPVIIQDIVIAALSPAKSHTLAGEFGNSRAEEQTQQIRLFNVIKDILERGAYKHKLRNCNNDNHVKQNKQNQIMRVVTNEFLFYTKKPLSIKEFNSLQEKILLLAKRQPENLHAVLGTFSVKTPDNAIMNVVVYVECGEFSRMQYIVKNNPSIIDPVYSEKINGAIIPLSNSQIGSDRIHDQVMLIAGKPHFFSYETIVECNTAGGAKFFTCIDICNDHVMGVTKNQLERKIYALIQEIDQGSRDDPIPMQCSQLLISNCVNAIPENVVGMLTHADPTGSVQDCKPGVGKLKSYSMPVSFGSTLTLFPTNPVICSGLTPDKMMLVKEANEKLVRRSSQVSLSKNAQSHLLSEYKAISEQYSNFSREIDSRSLPEISKDSLAFLKKSKPS